MRAATKTDIRRQILEKRSSLNKTEVMENSRLIKERLFSLPDFKNAKTLMFYASKDNEVFTHQMIKEALKEKTVVLPIMDRENMKIVVSKITSFEQLKPSALNILEPEQATEIDPATIELVIVPGVAFDMEKNRIGYGSGCYDVFLKTLKAKKIALAYDMQVLKKLPFHSHDVKVDIIITEKQII